MKSWTALIAGVLTLGIEIVAGRLLAPFFGSSLYQWAALIGVVLLAYALGYSIFAKLTRRGLSLPLALGGLYALSLPLWLHSGVSLLLALPMSLATVGAAILAVGIPSLLWASVLPYLQRHADKTDPARILAWSAAGNLLGAWGIAFGGIPVLGTRATLIAIGLAALGLSAFWLRSERRGVLRASSVVLVIWGLAWGMTSLISGSGRDSVSSQPWLTFPSRDPSRGEVKRALVEIKESPYQQIAVWDETDDVGTKRCLSLNGSLQFLWSRDEKLTAGSRYDYYNYSTAAASWVSKDRGAKSALILGLGGGLVPWQLRQYFPEIQVSSYELDPDVAKMAAKHLPLSETQGTRVDVHVGDGRILLKERAEKFDYILLDTFLNSYVPFHLTTREFFELVRDRLNPGGVLVANFHGLRYERPSAKTRVDDSFGFPDSRFLGLACRYHASHGRAGPRALGGAPAESSAVSPRRSGAAFTECCFPFKERFLRPEARLD
jgi:spermidine synthase